MTTRATGVPAALLSLVLAFACAPAEAVELARGLTVASAAPAPVLPSVPGLAAASLPISALASAPLSVPTLPAPAAVFSALPAPAAAAAAAPAAASAAAEPSARAAGASAPRVAQGALRALAAPETPLDSGRAFDGARAAPASAAAPARADAAASAAPPPLSPPKAKRSRSTAGRVLRAAAVGVGAAAAAPFLWRAAPAAEALILFAVALAPVVAGAALLLASRAARAVYRRFARPARAAADAPPSRRKLFAIRALGVALGVAMTAATAVEQRPLVEAAYSYMDSRLPEAERTFTTPIPGSFFGAETARVLEQSADGRAALDRVRGADGAPRMPVFFVTERRQRVVALPGTFFADSAAQLMSRNPVGRQVLDGLRDRGGVVRMPTFYVSYQVGSAARYAPPDAVYLSVETIEAGGVTVAEFLRDRQAQLRYLEREQSTILHELEHADQARRSPFNADTWVLLSANASRLAGAIKDYAFPPKTAASALTLAADHGGSDSKPAPAPGPKAEVAAAAVYLDAAEIARSGLTVERFVNDPESQKAYILGHQAELARALRPIPAAAPVVASPAAEPRGAAPAAAPERAKRSFSFELGMVQEWEYESYLTEHFYTHERLKADPSADIPSEEYSAYVHALGGFDEFLGSIDRSSIYAANFHGRSAYYARYLADMRARWDAHRVEAHVLLARRARAQGRPDDAREQLELARRIAADNGLPVPSLGD